MENKRSPEFIAIPMVAGAVVLALLALWAIAAGTALAWFVFSVVCILGAAAVIAVVIRRHRHPSADDRPLHVEPPDDGFYRVLVIVDAGDSSPELCRELVRSSAGRPTKALVVAPALSSRLDRWTGEQSAYDRAATELDSTLAGLRALGVEASGHIGGHDPLQAADEGLREFAADAIVFAIHQGGDVNWLEDGILEQTRDRTDLPVTHVVVQSG